jgi:AcrR family transcriptional regulator
MPEGSPANSNVTRLRPARRDVTRARICAAAKQVFLNVGYGGATLEQIALAADLRRSTVYNHFRDKNDILGAIAEDYLEAVTAVISRLPPKPSRRQIDRWVAEFADFVVRERAPTLLVVHGTAALEVPPATLEFAAKLLEAFAAQVPAFAEAIEPGQERKLARAYCVLRELGWALCYHIETEGGDLARYKLEVAADLLEQFVKGWF